MRQISEVNQKAGLYLVLPTKGNSREQIIEGVATSSH